MAVVVKAKSGRRVQAKETGIPEGNHSITNVYSQFVVKYLIITTVSTDWTLTVYSKDDYASDPITVLKNRSGSCTFHWDFPYEDKDDSSEFHYSFTDNAGSAIHDMEIVGSWW